METWGNMFHLDLIERLGGRCPGNPPTVDPLPIKTGETGEICRKKFGMRSLVSSRRTFPALLLGWKEQLGHWPFQGVRQAFEAVEGWAALAAFDEIEEVQRYGCLLRKLFLRHAPRMPDLAQPRAELLPKSAHSFESSESPPR